MTPTRKKVYIAVIVICFVASGIILYSSFHSSAPPPSAHVTTDTSGTGTTADTSNPTDTTTGDSGALGATVTYTAPAVFPAQTKFNWTILDSNQFKGLVPDSGITLQPGDLGRPDPTQNY